MVKSRQAWHAEIIAILKQRKEPLTAYGILGELRRFNSKIAPPTVYRALAALTDAREVHRLDSINSYVLCNHKSCSGNSHAAVLSICDDCGEVAETDIPEVFADLSTALEKSGFSAASHVIEVHGTCHACGKGG